jgi:hypothetical protein
VGLLYERINNNTMKNLMMVAVALGLIQCKPNATNNDYEALMTIHTSQRRAHIEENPDIMGGATGDFVVVNRGKVDSLHSPEKDRQRWQNYFDAVSFKKWDDIRKPTIRFSDDHSLAYMVVDKLVVLDTEDSAGNPIEETTHFAWVAIFRKQADGEWKMECMASTNEPEIIKPLNE